MNTTLLATATERGRAAGHNAAVARLTDPAAANRIPDEEAAAEANTASEELYPIERHAEGTAFAMAYHAELMVCLAAVALGGVVIGFND